MPELLDQRNLPDAVLERLAAGNIDARRSGLEVVQRGRILEARAFSRGELRLSEDGAPILDGYATVYEYPYDVAGGPPYGWIETMADGAADKTVRERDDVRLLINHDGLPLARTKSKTLDLVSDRTGVGCSTPSGLDLANPKVQELASVMSRDDADEMSIAFRVLRQEWNADYTERRIIEIMLFDVSVVTYPANPATVAMLRDADPVEVVERKGMPVALARVIADDLRSRVS